MYVYTCKKILTQRMMVHTHPHRRYLEASVLVEHGEQCLQQAALDVDRGLILVSRGRRGAGLVVAGTVLKATGREEREEERVGSVLLQPVEDGRPTQVTEELVRLRAGHRYSDKLITAVKHTIKNRYNVRTVIVCHSLYTGHDIHTDLRK